MNKMPDPDRISLINEAKTLLHLPRSGALATLRHGLPFTSLVTFAPDFDGSPIFLLSKLAIHTQNLATDPNCSLLLASTGKGDPLAHPRLTVSGEALPDTSGHLRARFLARQPKAALYAGFADFGFYRLNVRDLHLNGGFARAADFTPEEILCPPEQLAAYARRAEDLMAEINGKHTDELRQKIAQRTHSAAKNWQISGLDPEGIDLICGEEAMRIALTLHEIDGIEPETIIEGMLHGKIT